MMRALSFALVGLVCLVSLGRADEGADRRDAAKKDLERLQGTWTLVAMETDGDAVPAEHFEGWTATYEGNELTLRSGDEVRRRGIVTLDPSRTPKAMNTWDKNGPYEDLTLAGIYELNGDNLKLCFSRPGKDRPTKFESKDGPGFLVVTYKRKKP